MPLKETGEGYRLMGMFAPWGIHFYELMDDGRLVFMGANPAADRMLGMDHRPLVDLDIEQAFPSLAGTGIPDSYRRVALTGVSWSSEQVDYEDERIKGGFEVYAFQISPRRMAAAFLDITERKRNELALRESERRLRLLHDTMLQGVVYQDAIGQIISGNPAAERILGWDHHYLGRTSEDEEYHTIREDGSMFPGLEHPSMEALRTGKEQKDVVMGIYNHHLKEYRWIKISAVPLFRQGEKTPYQVYTIFDDITELKNIEMELRRSEEMFRGLYENSLENLNIWKMEYDEAGNIVDWTLVSSNPAAERSMALLGPDQIGKRATELFGEEFMSRHISISREVMATRRGQQFEAPFTAMRKHFLASQFPVGKDLLAVGTVDITDSKDSEKALENERARLQFILDSLPVAVELIDDKGITLLRNRQTYVIWAAEASKIPGHGDTLANFSVFQTGSGRPIGLDEHPLIRAVYKGEIVQNEQMDIERFDGTRGTIMISCLPLRDESGEIKGGLAAYMDISEQKGTEEALARSNYELEQFAYVASHDLQEPLRMVVNHLSLLDKNYSDKLDARAKMFISVAVEGGRRMRELIDDLLEFSRIDTRAREFGQVEMDALVRRTLELFADDMSRNGIEVDSGELPTIMADESQMSQVLQNLIGNAIKFRQRERPWIRIGCIQSPREYQFYVQDNGIGLNPQYSEQIFQMFQKLHTKEEYPGTGVGLAIAKKIVERHGGRIWVESEEGMGATFFFTVPKLASQ